LDYLDWILATGCDVKLDDMPAPPVADTAGDAHDSGSCPTPAKAPRTSLFASYRKPAPSAEKAAVPLTSVVSSYLAYVQLIRDGTLRGWHSVASSSQGQQAVCLFEVVV